MTDTKQDLFEYQFQIGFEKLELEFIWTNYVSDVEDTLIKRLYKTHSFKRVNEYCTKVHLYLLKNK